MEKNPMDAGFLFASASSTRSRHKPSNVFDASDYYWQSENKANQYLTIDLRNYSFVIKSVLIETYPQHFPSQWVLSGSNDNSIYEDISGLIEMKVQPSTKRPLVFDIQSKTEYRYFRIEAKAPSFEKSNYFVIKQLEIYGDHTENPKLQSRNVGDLQFDIDLYTSGPGVIGYFCEKSNGLNPMDAGVLFATASTSDQDFKPSNIFDWKQHGWVSEDKPNQFLTINLNEAALTLKKIEVLSKDNFFMQPWSIYGSIDDEKYDLIFENDSLDVPAQAIEALVYEVPNSSTPYRFIRIQANTSEELEDKRFGFTSLELYGILKDSEQIFQLEV